MASSFNINITRLQIYSMFLMLLALEVCSVNTVNEKELTVNEKLLKELQGLIKFYKEDLDWELKDAIDGIIHWGINDFSDSLLARKDDLLETFPSCVVRVEIAREQIISNSSLVKPCFQNLYNKLEEAKELSTRVFYEDNLDKLIDLLASYRDSKNTKILNCYLPSYLFAYNLHKEIIYRIDACTNEINIRIEGIEKK